MLKLLLAVVVFGVAWAVWRRMSPGRYRSDLINHAARSGLIRVGLGPATITHLQRSCLIQVLRSPVIGVDRRVFVPGYLVVSMSLEDWDLVEPVQEWFADGLCAAADREAEKRGWTAEPDFDVVFEPDHGVAVGCPRLQARSTRPAGSRAPVPAPPAPRPGPGPSTEALGGSVNTGAMRTQPMAKTGPDRTEVAPTEVPERPGWHAGIVTVRDGAPDAAGARLTLMGTDPSGEVIRIGPGPGRWTVGRSRDCSRRVAAKTVSGVHCAFSCTDGEWFVEDCDSSNGTFLNGDLVEGRARVRFGDLLSLGEAVQFRCSA